MRRNFSGTIYYNGEQRLVTVVSQVRKDGMYYEINIGGFPRFYMSWTLLGRYDITLNDSAVPYEVILAVSDLLEENCGKGK